MLSPVWAVTSDTSRGSSKRARLKPERYGQSIEGRPVSSVLEKQRMLRELMLWCSQPLLCSSRTALAMGLASRNRSPSVYRVGVLLSALSRSSARRSVKPQACSDCAASGGRAKTKPYVGDSMTVTRAWAAPYSRGYGMHETSVTCPVASPDP